MTAEPTEDELRMLEALVRTGSTDETVAARLGLSARTLSRRLDSVMAKLGARSRLQAGYRLAQAGWLGDVSPRHADICHCRGEESVSERRNDTP